MLTIVVTHNLKPILSDVMGVHYLFTLPCFQHMCNIFSNAQSVVASDQWRAIISDVLQKQGNSLLWTRGCPYESARLFSHSTGVCGVSHWSFVLNRIHRYTQTEL